MSSTRNICILVALPILIKSVLSDGCELVFKATVLNCSNLSVLPDAPHDDIETINFNDNNFKELRPHTFYVHRFHHVNRILIRQSNISYIHSKAFANMSSVVELDLYANNIAILNKDVFDGLRLLHHLDLGHNQIISLEEKVFNSLPALDTLDLSQNHIKNIPLNLLKGTKTTELDLSGNPIEFPEEGPFLKWEYLTALALQSCSLRILPSDIFINLLGLIFLDLSNNRLEDISPRLLKPLSRLEQLDISYNSITHIDVNVLPSPTMLDAILCDENPFEDGSVCEELLSLGHQQNSYVTSSPKPKATHTESFTKAVVTIETALNTSTGYGVSNSTPNVPILKPMSSMENGGTDDSETVELVLKGAILLVSLIDAILLLLVIGLMLYYVLRKGGT